MRQKPSSGQTGPQSLGPSSLLTLATFCPPQGLCCSLLTLRAWMGHSDPDSCHRPPTPVRPSSVYSQLWAYGLTCPSRVSRFTTGAVPAGSRRSLVPRAVPSTQLPVGPVLGLSWGWALPEEGFVSIYRVLRPDHSLMQGVPSSTREESRGIEGGQVDQERRGRDLTHTSAFLCHGGSSGFLDVLILGLLDLDGPV